jgi:DNA-binding transcriptional MerR regulator
MASRPAPRWRIGVLASRVGVSETLLRAWEVRYGLLSPTRSDSGYRLYGPEDERRARAMQDARRRGVPAGQAAAEVLAAERSDHRLPGAPGAPGAPGPRYPTSGALDVTGTLEELRAAMVAYDVSSMHAALDRVLAEVSAETAIKGVLLPFLAGVGDGWAAGELDVADEHFASDLVRARLAALSIAPGSRSGPLALLACPPTEQHDIALKAFEVVLLRAGWRTRFLGPRTPVASLEAAVAVVAPDLLVLAGTAPGAFDVADVDRAAVGRVAAATRVVLAGAVADEAAALRWGAEVLAGDPVTAARSLVGTGRRASRQGPEDGTSS